MFFDITKRCPLLGKYKYEFLSALCANVIALGHGAGLAWLSPTLLVLQSPDTPLLSGELTVDEASWLGSVLPVGGFIGNLGFGFIANRWGRKTALCLIALPQTCFWIIVMFANDVSHLYIGRMIGGMTGGGVFVTIPLYISDIASKEIRGSLGSILMLAVNCGTLVGYTVGSYLPYSLVPKVLIVLPLTHICLFVLFPETPQFLLLKNDKENAKKSLCFYRSLDETSKDKQVMQEIEKEMEEMISVMGNTPTDAVTYKDFISRDSRKGMILGIGLVAVNIFSGIFFIVNYNALIFRESRIEIPSNEATIIVAISQIAGTYLSTLIVDRFRRKTLLMATTALAGIGFFLTGMSTFMAAFYDMTHLSWMPVVNISLTVFSASVGYIPLTFVVLNEVIPRKVRPIIASFCNAMLNVFAFASLKSSPIIIAFAGLHTVMWICSGMCLLGVLFNAVFIPETRGKVI